MSAAPPQIIFFDVDGVLIHGYHARPELRRCWDENLTRDFGIDRERFTNEFIRGPFVNEVLIGKKDIHAALSEWLPTQGFKDDAQIFIDYWLKNDATINRDLLEKIRLIKASGKTRLFIATNQEHNRARYLMRELGFARYFKDIFYSARIGAMKPDMRYFQWISERLNIAGEPKPVFFDDTPAVVAAARAHGWDAIEFLGAGDLDRSAAVKEILSGTWRS